MSVRTLVEEFSALEDPRCGGKVEHRLIDILVIAVCAVIAGAESWEDIALYGRNTIDWLGTFRALPNGIPAHDTFRRVFLLIDTGGFERGFAAWVRSFGAPVDRDVVAIDGKTIRGSFDRGREQGPLHVVSAWACDRRLVLGQRQIGDKSNEITAIPELLTALDLKGAIVTLDAMGCQRAIATRILENGLIISWCSRRTRGRNSPLSKSFAPRPGSAARPSTGRSMTNLMMATAAWFGAACSSARMLPGWNRCATGPACRPSWPWKPSVMSMGLVRPKPTSATFCPAAPIPRRSWQQRSAGTGRLRIACTGFSTSPSKKITAGCGIGTPSRISRCCGKSRSTVNQRGSGVHPHFRCRLVTVAEGRDI